MTNDLKIGAKVRLAIDTESLYQIIEINPHVFKGITIRKFSDGLKILVNKSEITEITEES